MAQIKSRAALAVVIIALVGSLSACGGNPIKNAVDDAVGNAVDKGTEKVIEEAAGGDADVDLGLDGNGAKLPDDFPDDIPLPDAKLTATVSQQEGWFLAFEPVDISAVESLVAEYKSSWETQAEADYGEWKTWSFTNGTQSAIISAIDDGEGWTISLTAVPITP